MKFFSRDLWQRYKLLKHEYDDLVLKQEGKCAVCNDDFEDNDCVDHDHNTGKVRGLLCPSCNKGLGFFKDSALRLIRAINYLLRGK